jgi:hypothetical protein
MKRLLPLLLLSLCGCRTPAPMATLPAPPTPVPVRPQAVPTVASPPLSRPATAIPDPRSRQQAQLIEALINQNEALTIRLAALQAAPVATSSAAEPVAVVAQPAPVVLPSVPVATPVAAEPAIAPNAEGVIDLSAIEQADNANEPVNPFAVRTAPGEKTREVTLLVGGIILGKAPCALVNGRLVQAGDIFEGFEVERVEAGAVIVRFGAYRLRLPVSPAPTRVKLAL